MRKRTSHRYGHLQFILGSMLALLLLYGAVVFLMDSFRMSPAASAARVTPHELVFFEHSPQGAEGGSIVPASCPSGYAEGPHTAVSVTACGYGGSGGCPFSRGNQGYPYYWGYVTTYAASCTALTQTCWNGAVIPVSQTCPPSTQTCWNGAVISVYDSCPPSTQTCWNGSVIPVTSVCPPSTQTCWDGSVIPVTSTCPPSTQTCWDGSVISVYATCPPPTQTCWDGSVISIYASCPPQPTLSLTANPTSVLPGAASTLTWSSGNVSSCTASNAWTGTKTLSGSQSTGALSVTPNTYTLNCTGVYGSVSRTATVTIPAPTLTITANPTTVTYGGASTLTWSTTNATACTASGSWTGTRTTAGTESTGPLTSTPNTYTMTCTGPGGSVTKNADATTGSTGGTSVTIPAPTATLQVRVNGGAWTTAAQLIEQTDTINLQWGSTNASKCDGANFATAEALSGIATNVTEPESGTTKIYSVTCPGATGTSPATASVRVTTRSNNPTLIPNDIIVPPGATTIIGYDLNNNASCTFSTTDGEINGDVVTTNGSKTTGAIFAKTTYTLNCGGGNTATVTINVEGNIQEQ